MGQRATILRCVAGSVVLLLAAPAPAVTAAPGCRPRTERTEAGAWTFAPVKGIAGGSISWRMSAASDLRTVVVADSGGIQVSRDGGCHWDRTLAFADAAPGWALRAEDAEVAGRGRDPRLYVVTVATFGARMVLFSSDDGGRTWAASDLPVDAAAPPIERADLSVGAGDAALYLSTIHRTGTGTLHSSDDGGATWETAAVTSTVAPAGACVPSGPCSAPPLRQVVPDPHVKGRVWALTTASASGDPALVVSADGGASWERRPGPELLHGPALADVAPGPRRSSTALLLGDFGDFALSRDGGASWEAGDFPEVADGSESSSQSSDVAHTGNGRSFATLLGDVPHSAWTGNVMVLTGREWVNASPERYRGYAPEDGEGTLLGFTELTGSRDSFVMLTRAGELAVLRPAR